MAELTAAIADAAPAATAAGVGAAGRLARRSENQVHACVRVRASVCVYVVWVLVYVLVRVCVCVCVRCALYVCVVWFAWCAYVHACGDFGSAGSSPAGVELLF